VKDKKLNFRMPHIDAMHAEITKTRFAPGSIGFHELMDRTCMIAEMFGDYCVNHPAADHPKLRKKFDKIEGQLCGLYQRIANLLPEEPNDPAP
jgi:hypothetical protein